jgi:hypothetical protein
MRAHFLHATVTCAAAAVVAGMAAGPAWAHTPGPSRTSGLVQAPRHSRAGRDTLTAQTLSQWRPAHRDYPSGRLAPASAQLPALVSNVPVDWTPNVFPGATTCNTQWFGPNCAPSIINGIAVVNGEVVVGGAFTQVCVPGPATDGHCQPGTTVTRNDIFAYQLDSGAIDPNFAPVLDKGPVTSVVAGPGNTVYVGGSFTTVNGTAHSDVVQLSVTPGTASDGQVVSAFAGQLTGFANATVNSLAYQGNALYVGGIFTHADGAPSTGLARLNATTGAVDTRTHFGFTLSDPVSGSAEPGIGALALSPDGGHLVIGGSFLQVNGQSRPRLAMINTGGGFGATASLANWLAPIMTNNCSHQHDYVRGIDFSPDGSFFVVVTTGLLPSPPGPSLCDAAARFETGASGTNVQPVWINYTGGDTLDSVAVAGSVAYVGGHNRWINNECGDNAVCEANAVLVNGVAALDTHTGLALPWWQPGTTRGVGVHALTVLPAGASPSLAGGLLLGTDVNTVGGAFHSENALFPLTTTTVQAPGGPVMSGMFSQGRPGGSAGTTQGSAAQCVDAANDGSANGTKVQFWTCLNDAAQNWTIQPDGTIRINGACLAVAGSTQIPPNGAKIQLWACNGASNQQWRQGQGNTLVNGAGGKCLDDPNASTTNGIQLQLWTCNGGKQQTWPLPVAQAPPPPPPTGPVYSALEQTGGQVPCLDDPGGSTTSGTLVQLWTCLENSDQTWTISSNGTIQVSGLCLDTQGGATSNGTPVVLNACGKSSQVWRPASNHSLVNQAAGKCLDDTDSNTANGADLQIWSCTGGLNQQWRLPAL